jgi:hypothetical protein
LTQLAGYATTQLGARQVLKARGHGLTTLGQHFHTEVAGFLRRDGGHLNV